MIATLFLLFAVNAYELRAGVTPVQKVIQLLDEMHAKGTKEMKDEEVRQSAHSMWCLTTMREKGRLIGNAAAKMEQLEADIAKAASDVEALTDDIAGLDSDIARWKQDQKAATEVRTKEKADYTATHQDYSESLDALERAIATLSAQSHDRKQAASLLQKVVTIARLPAASRSALTAFLDSAQPSKDPDPMNVAAPEANAYEFQSGGVIDMLKNLDAKFNEERDDLFKNEKTARHAYEMMIQELTDSIEGAVSEKNRKTKEKAQREQDGAEAKGDLADTTATHDADVKYLTDTKAECLQKAADFKSRQTLRKEELEAISQARDIIASGSVSGASEKHLPQFTQTSLMQKFMSGNTAVVQNRVAKFLSDRAAAIHSRTLQLLATKVADDPFAKVKKMIKDLIVRLMEEANEETEHKGWCDTELSTNEVQRKSKQEAVETLTAEADQLSADIAKLGQEISDLNAAIQEIDSSVAQSTSERQAEKAANEETIKDAKEAQVAVAQALAVLKDFYAKAAEATALVQGPAEDAPETFSESYKGMQSESGGVIGMLEVIASDFSRLESDTASSEEAAAEAYKNFSNDSEVDRATKAQDVTNKENLKSRKTKDLAETNGDLQGTQQELDSVLAYYEKLKPSCVDAGVDYDDRVARREAEIQSLKEALEILSSDDA